MLIGHTHNAHCHDNEWQVRILNVQEALLLKRYPDHVTEAVLNLRVQDPLLTHNNGTFALIVRDGRTVACQSVGEGIGSTSCAMLVCMFL